MEVDAFTEALGTRQGRVRIAEGGAYVFVLGDLQARTHELALGDYVELVQDVDLTAEVLVRLSGAIRVPEAPPNDWAWEVSITIDGEKRARLRAVGGREHRLDDLAAYVAQDVGVHTVAVRLELVRGDG